MCLYPKLIDNPKYKANKKNGGVIPPVNDKRQLKVPIGCGNCIECRKKKSSEWKVRLSEDIKVNKDAIFVTLTFSNESLIELQNIVLKNVEIKGYELDNAIATQGVRYFLERWRKKHKKSLRHWFITELGGNNTERIHIHGLIWMKDKNYKLLSKAWKYGIITVGERKYNNGRQLDKKSTGYVNNETIGYIVKYVHKVDLKHKGYKSKILTSAGIGSNYIKDKNKGNVKNNKYIKKTQTRKTNESYTTREGFKLALPIYYRNYIYTEEEREKLWSEKLDEEIRYVNGKKIDISKGYEEWYKAIEVQRLRNKELGYGSNEIDWDKQEYENQLRDIKRRKIEQEIKRRASS